MDECVSAISAKHEVEKAQMRKWVVTSILDSERAYVSMLDVLLQVRDLNSPLIFTKCSRQVPTLAPASTTFNYQLFVDCGIRIHTKLNVTFVKYYKH